MALLIRLIFGPFHPAQNGPNHPTLTPTKYVIPEIAGRTFQDFLLTAICETEKTIAEIDLDIGSFRTTAHRLLLQLTLYDKYNVYNTRCKSFTAHRTEYFAHI